MQKEKPMKLQEAIKNPEIESAIEEHFGDTTAKKVVKKFKKLIEKLLKSKKTTEEIIEILDDAYYNVPHKDAWMRGQGSGSTR